jgi:CRP-like cAMP-binding protein
MPVAKDPTLPDKPFITPTKTKCMEILLKSIQLHLAPMQQLIKNIKQFAELSKDSLDVVISLFSRIEYKRGDELIRFGKPCQSLFLVEKGFCRAFNIQDGEEVNLEFFFEYETVTNKNSYLFNKPSDFAVVACEPMIVYKIERKDLLEAIRQYPEIEVAGKRNLELIAAKQEKQLQLFRILTAKGRYEFLEQNDPDLLQRVPISQLASYLGVKRETLSRIRNKRMRSVIL